MKRAQPEHQGTMLLKGWWPGLGKPRIEPIPQWSEASRQRLAARYRGLWRNG